MADAFRGLTLRIGADARPLQSAIGSITQSAAQAQRQMNKLNKALEFDSTNVKLMQSRLDLVGDKALHSARAMSKIQMSMRQAASETLKFSERSGLGSQKVRDLANNMTRVYSATQKARSEQTHVAAELQHIYDAAKKVAHVDMGITWQKADKYVKGLQRNLSMGGAAADRAEAKLTDLFTKIKADSAVFEKFGLMAGDVKGLEERFHALRGAYKEVSSDLKNLRKVEGFRNATADAKVFESEVRQAAAQAAKFATEMHKLGTKGNLASGVNQIKRLENATDQAVTHAKAMSDAYKAVPNSMSTLAHKTSAVAAAEKTLKANIDAINSAMDKIRRDPAFDKMAEGSQEAYIKAEKVEQAYEDIHAALTKATAKAEAWKEKLNSAMESGKVKEGSNKIKLYEAAIEAAENKVTELKSKLASLDDAHAAAALTLEMKELENAAAKATTQMASLKAASSRLNALASVGKGLRNFGFGMYASVTPAAMMAGRYMIQAAEDTDSAYRDMRKTVNGTEEDFEHLRDAAIEFSTTHITSADEILEIEAMGGQLGLAVADLEAFAETIANLDISTNIDAEDAAEKIGKMASVVGISSEEYDNFGDALVRLGNNMPVLESDIMTVMPRFMGMGKVVNMTADEMLGWSAAASATGMGAEAAGSSMQRFISKMETAVAGSDEDLQAWADVAGMSVDEFRTAFGDDASSTMYKFVEGLSELQKNGDSVNQTLMELGFNNVRDKTLLEGFANQVANSQGKVNLLADSLEMASDAYRGAATQMADGTWERAGDAAREAQKKQEGFSGSIKIMRNQAKAMLIELSEGATPLVSQLGDMFGDLTKRMREAPDSMKTLIVELIAVGAAIGPVTVGVGTLLQSFNQIGAAGKTAMSGFTRLSAALNKANLGRAASAVGALGTSVGMLGATSALAGVALMIKMLVDYRKHIEEVKVATSDAVNIARDFSRLGNNLDMSILGGSAKAEAMSVRDAVSETAKMLGQQRSALEETQSSMGRLAAAQQTISKYADTDLSGNVRAQGELRAAVDAVNEICGTQISVIDAVNGKLQDEAGQLDATRGALVEYIETQKEQLRMSAMSDYLEELYQTEYDQMLALSAAEDKLREERDKNRGQGIGGDASADSKYIQQLEADVETARAAYENTQQAIDQTTESLGLFENEANNVKISVGNLVAGNIGVHAGFQEDAEAIATFADEMQKAGVTFDEVSQFDDAQWRDAVAAYKENGNQIKYALDELGLSTRTLFELYAAEIQNAQGSTEAWDAAIQRTGMSEQALAIALDEAGISAVEFASIGASSFDALYTAANGDFDLIRQEIDLLEAGGLDLGSVTINDDGLLQVGDHVIELNGELATIDGQEYKVSANGEGFELVQEDITETETEAEEGATMEVDAEYSEVDDAEAAVEEAQDVINEGANFEVTADTEELQSVLGEMLSSGDMAVNATVNFESSGSEEVSSTWESLKSSVAEGAQGTLTFDTSSMEQAIEVSGNLKTAIENIPESRGIYITVVGDALSTISSIWWSLASLPTYKEIEIRTIRSEAERATGGIFTKFAAGGMIPSHAQGALNGIVRSATLTNIGWVGEAGAEAVMHMRNAGGAVVPLTNRRYVRPFARAVAYEAMDMGGYGMRGGDTYNTTINTTGSGDELARTLTGALNTYSRLHGHGRRR